MIFQKIIPVLKKEEKMRIEKQKGIILLLFCLFSVPLLFSQTEEASKVLAQNNAGVLSLIIYGDKKEEIGKGTGFAVSEEIIATTYHLISQASEVEGINFKKKKMKVEGIVAVDKNLDLALLKIKGKAQALSLGNSDALEMGKRVFAIGTNEASEIVILEGTIQKFFELSPTQRFVDSSIKIPEVSSGGPLLDANGQVLGINIALEKRLKFIIPINILKSLKRAVKAIEFKNWQREDYLSTFEGAYFVGRASAKLDDTSTAQKYLEKVATLNPTLIEVHSLLASVYSSQRDYRSAAGAYQKVIELDPKRADAHLSLGLIDFKMQRYKEAIASMEKAIELNPDNNQAYNSIASAYEELKDFAKASEAYEKYLNLKPENPWTAYFHLGLCRVELGQFENAIAAFQQALKGQPEDAQINYNLSQVYQKADQYEKAEEVYKFLAELKPQDAIQYYRMIVYMYDSAKLYDKAIEAAKKVVELDPKSVEAAYNLGVMYVKLDKYDEAIKAFQQSLSIRPDYDLSYYQIGFCYSKMKRYKDSIAIFKKFVEISPDNADGWFNIGIGYMLLKDFKSALEPLRKCVELRPDYGVAQYNLAIAYLNLRDNYSAREVYKALVNIDPNLAQKLKKLLR
jgi:tetratricopeptide (TPR) repeat protein